MAKHKTVIFLALIASVTFASIASAQTDVKPTAGTAEHFNRDKPSHIVISPPEPAAFEAFEISFSGPHAWTTRPVNLDVVDGVITLEYAGLMIDFGYPADRQQITVALAGLAEGTYVLRFLLREGIDTPALLSDSETELTVRPAPVPQDVFAFYNVDIGHYFVTASEAERDLVLEGGAGRRWLISDAGFKAWPAAGPAPAAAQPVCRFYSALVNSHFYTAGAGECELLKQPDSGWIFEGIAFRALIPARGACPAGTEPVWRLYNDRAAELDSNHRFLVGSETYRSMIADGWIGEGVAFCSPT